MTNAAAQPQPVIVRGARESELPAILELTCAAFGEQVRERMRVMLWGDSSLRLDDLRVAAIGDELVACVRIADRPIHYGEATLRMGGIGAVSTHPAHRHHGYASLVMRDAEAEMRRSGYQLGMLFTGIAPFYQRLGWVPFPEHFTDWRLEANEAMELPESLGVRKFNEESDLRAVCRIYDDASTQWIAPCVRSPQHWRDAQSRFLGIMPELVVERGGEVVAYASVRLEGSRMDVGEAACRTGATDAYASLAVRIWHEARVRGATTVRAHLPVGHGLVAALHQQSGGLREERGVSWMMLRLLELIALLRAATPEMNRRLAMAGCSPRPYVLGLRVEADYARLVVRDGAVHVDAKDVPRELVVPAELFFRMFLGEQTATVLREQLALAGASPTDDEMAVLDALFPQRAPIYWRADHF